MDRINKYQNKHISDRYNTGGYDKSLTNFKFDVYDLIEGIGYDFQQFICY